MNYAENKGVRLALADAGKQLIRLNERLDNQDCVLNVKVFFISHFIQSTCLYFKWNLIVLFWFVAMNTKSGYERAMNTKNGEALTQIEERLSRSVESNQVIKFTVFLYDLFLFKII